MRVARARARSLRLRLQHQAEVRRGEGIPQRADRTPIFILGAPRSGTTLLYQLLVEGLDVGWLANAHMAAPGDVCRIEREQRPRSARAASDFESAHGATRAPWEPSEAGEYWYRFVPRDRHQLDESDATPARVRALRSGVRLFMDACAGSVVFKNVFHTLRIPVLALALPEARFLLIERDEAANARSLLAGRARRGDLQAWWSARPDGSELVRDASAAEQVVWQVRRMNAVARAALDSLHPDRVLRLRYEDVCTDPRGVLEQVHGWLRRSGAAVELRAGAAVPARFQLRDGGELAPELETQLRAALASGPSGEDAR